jgi:hypothetical protein
VLEARFPEEYAAGLQTSLDDAVDSALSAAVSAS